MKLEEGEWSSTVGVTVRVADKGYGHSCLGSTLKVLYVLVFRVCICIHIEPALSELLLGRVKIHFYHLADSSMSSFETTNPALVSTLLQFLQLEVVIAKGFRS